jgi:excisionase family DNA binding protein
MELYTVDETARLLRVSPITIRRYIASGELEAVRVGRGVRVQREAIERFVKPLAPRHDADEPRRTIGRSFTKDDPLWSIVGIGQSEGPNDVASNKHENLTKAYMADKG